jgi:NADH-quinone oxidoreductase subunit H
MLAIDPLLNGSLTFGDVVIVLVKVVAIFAIGLIATMLMVWFERKVIAGMQNRIGPNKAGPFGILQTLADGIKLFFKEDLTPDRSDRFVFRLAPYLAFVPAFLVWSVIPLGGRFEGGNGGRIILFKHATLLQLADPQVGVLLLLALSALAVYGIMLAGWASGSKYPLLGSVRASAQMVSYEAAMGLSLAAVILVSGTLSTNGIVAHQSSLSRWGIVGTAFVPFAIFLVAATAELNRPPFDLVEAEQELVGGFNTEYSSIRFGLFYLAEFMNTVTMSGVIVTLFFGGPQPLKIGGNANILRAIDPLSGTVWFFLKLLVFLYIYVWFRATLPRLRYDQLMNLGWKVMIPIALAWFMLLTYLKIGGDEGWTRSHKVIVSVVSLAVLALAAGLLSLAMSVGSRSRQREGSTF